jgi:serine/threonine-protein kinase Nek2
MEYCGGGDLGTFIKNLKNKFAEERFVWHILAQLVTALALYRCHYGVDPPEVGSNILEPVSVKPSDLRILHRDLKPGNSKL